MEELISRREFFSQLIPTPRTLSSKPVPENPFRGQVFWNPRRERFEPLSAVDRDGTLLSSLTHSDAFATIMEPPPRPHAKWDFSISRWVTPLGYQDVYRRLVVGREVLRECFSVHSRCAEALAMIQAVRKIFPEVNVYEALLIGRVEASDVYPDDIISLYYDMDMKPLENLKELFGVTELVARYSLKLHLQSQKKFLKIMLHAPEGPSNPALFLPEDHLPWNLGLTRNLNKALEPIRDFYFFASNSNMEEYCQRLGLPYPENLFKKDKEVQTFAVTYDELTGKILKIKRYYIWTFQ
jgi:hypothetical protein